MTVSVIHAQRFVTCTVRLLGCWSEFGVSNAIARPFISSGARLSIRLAPDAGPEWFPQRVVMPESALPQDRIAPDHAARRPSQPNQARSTHSSPAEGDAILLTAPQVAKRLGIGIRTVWRLSATGELPAPIAIGRLKRWHLGAIMEFLRVRHEDAQRRCS